MIFAKKLIPKPHQLRGKLQVVFIMTLLIAAVAVTKRVSGRTFNPFSRTGDTKAGTSTAHPELGIATNLSGPVQGKHELVETERITLLPDGFQPSSIIIPAKKFFLAVDNRSGLREMSLRIDREAGPNVHSVTIDHKKLNWSDLFELTPGNYVLSESNHANLRCTITVTNK